MTVHSPITVSLWAGLTALLLSSSLSFAQEERTWAEIRSAIIGESVPADGAGRLSLVAPTRAEDAAIVPIELRIRIPEEDTGRVTKITLVVDENPAPVAAV